MHEASRIKLKTKLSLFACTVAGVLAAGSVLAYGQQPGGPPSSLMFYSARDAHPNNQIYVMDPDGGDQMRLTYDTASDVDPAMSPNGREILFTSNSPGNYDIFVRDLSGTTTNLTNNPANDEWARWSPNGQQIVFGSNRDGGVFQIYLMDVDGNNIRQLTTDTVMSRYADWSPNGHQLAFRHNIDIAVLDLGSGILTQLTHETAPSFAQMPAYSPNGQYIVFMSFRDGYCSVFRMNSDGTDQVNLTPKNSGDPNSSWCSRAPSWSADGQEIFFMSKRPGTNGDSHIFAMDADGDNVRQLTSDGNNGSPRVR